MILYIAKVESSQPIRLISSVGKQLPLYCTSLGRALLAYKSDDEIRNMFPSTLKSYTPNTVTNIDALLKELVATRERGYAMEREETNQMINCIAVSLNYHNNPIAAISVSIPTFRLNEQKIQETVNVLFEAKRNIESHFKTFGVDFGNLD